MNSQGADLTCIHESSSHLRRDIRRPVCMIQATKSSPNLFIALSIIQKHQTIVHGLCRPAQQLCLDENRTTTYESWKMVPRSRWKAPRCCPLIEGMLNSQHRAHTHIPPRAMGGRMGSSIRCALSSFLERLTSAVFPAT